MVVGRPILRSVDSEVKGRVIEPRKYKTLGALEDKPWVIARKRFGRITIANSDAARRAYTDAAIDQAHRAVQELLKSKLN